MWTSWTPHQAVPQACSGSRKRPRARVGGSTRARENDIPTPPPFPPGAVIAVGWTQVGDFCHVPVMIAGVSCTALLDTGSNATLVRPNVVPTGAAVQPTNREGVFQFKVGDLGVPYAAWVADVQDACILGLDFLRAIGGVLDLGKGFLILPDGKRVQLIPPPVCPASAAASTSTSETPAYPLTALQAGEEERLSAMRSIWSKNCEGLTPQQQESLWQVLKEFRDIFVLKESDVGLTHLVEHVIETGDPQPIKVRPRRLPLAHQEAADRELCEMMKAGIIEPSDSPWASAVVMVPKKNSPRMRFCVDYRPLNKVTKKDSYPLPRIDESLDLVDGSSWFSTLDLRSGYWQVPLSPDSRPKTAFCTNRGLWQFKVLSFGLCNAPATFERLMDSVLAGVPRQRCLVYLDDLLVHGSSFDAALDALRQVLGRVAAAGLKLHPDKCHFMRREVEFLGHKLGHEGISTLEEKIHTITEWPTPADQKQLKSFLGLASYYRRFVKGFSSIAAPLFRLLQKDCDFIRTQDCQQAFNTLCRSLTESPVLAPPDPALPFVLDTDASNVGLGAVLSQVGPDGEKVVAYFSWVLNRSERRYCVTRRELLAVVAGVRHFKYYLCGTSFVIRTDHAALQWLMSFREPEGQVARWLEELQAFNFTVEHRAGTHHSNADALSRRPCAAAGCRYCEKREETEQELTTMDGLQQQPPGAPMKRVAVDVMGPFPLTDRGNRYVLVAMDYFTKWPEAYAIPDQEAETVADALVEGMFSHFGTAETLHSDQGRNFESKVFAAMCERLGVKKTRTTPLHPQSDGLVERFNRTLAQQLAILTSEHQQDWDYHFPLTLMAYRSAVQDSTQCTLALLMLGRELRTPAELAFGKPPDAPEAPPGRDYARKLQERLDSAHSYAREQLAKAGLRQKRNYDITTKGRHFRAGELVWVYSPKRKKGRCPKLDSSWVGPCSVVERVGEVVYRVQLPPRGRKVVLHRDRMAPYRGQSLPEERLQSPHDPAQRDPWPELHSPPSGSSPQSPKAPSTPQGLRRSRRERRLPPRLRDCVVPSGTRNLLLGGQCNDG
ncbi:uncharacterized protein LOC134629763 [Pelmatolapia mariae]|uniref:uncharacterized protein LOC134629763 n=1 Tax=Pelmatolapia mariae TaxID=158779 RepID=UPI002FE5A69F